MGLRIHTLGPFRVHRDDTPIPDSAWKTQKNKALLKVLLTQRRHALTKEQLMEWLWPDMAPDAAGRNLRVAVSQLRRALEPDLPRRAESSFVLTTDAGYTWNARADCWLDAGEFETRAAEFRAGAHAADVESQIANAERARALYRGDYLEGDRYADWATAERERLRELYFALLTRLAEVYARRGRYRRAVALCRDVLAADRCRESVWCQLMLYHYHASDQALAGRAYEECRQALAEELGVDPMPTTTALAEQIRNRAVAGEHTYPLPAAIERVRQLPVSLSRMPFVGRDQEFARLAGHWKAVQSGRGHAVIIQGEAGLGKTRLAQELFGAARQQGAWVLQGKARELEGVLPYQPLVDALRSAGETQHDSLETLDVVWRVELSRLLPEWSLPGAVSPPAGSGSLDSARRQHHARDLRASHHLFHPSSVGGARATAGRAPVAGADRARGQWREDVL